ncbi:MAG: hypothetical protein WEC84_02595 [Candidatus Andersenbacteria bacterium]
MNSTGTLVLLLLVFLVGILIALIRAEGGLQPALEGVGELGIPTPQPRASASPTPVNAFTSGNSRFSQGRCTTDSECRPMGCSGEVCSSGKDVITTCSYSESFPNAQGLSCGCVNTVCGWK